eukprot:m.56076 g.56076  ORF g.56076 m.56076 type:complete len:458 (-) comp22177_c0_seq2:163-1536(-)
MIMLSDHFLGLFLGVVCLLAFGNADSGDTSYIFFMKAPTSPAFENITMLQQNPNSFNPASMSKIMSALGFPGKSTPGTLKMQVGLTFQWELLDCFLSPHTCTTAQTIEGIQNFLNGAVSANIPVEITLDPVQFYYETNLWNWWDPTLPGFNVTNVKNVEWIGWSPENATMIAWRNWGSQFRMPTPQPNLASPALIKATNEALGEIVTAIRTWYEAQSASAQQLLVGIKLGEEVDVGFNYYYYPNGNAIYQANPHNATGDPDPTKYGPNWSKGLSGGLPAQGYNMLQTLGIRNSGGPPTRQEITRGVRNYYSEIIGACVRAWPQLATNGLLGTHGGGVSDPLLIEWSSAMVPPATPGYSFYFGPGQFKAKGGPLGQPGLRTALEAYDPEHLRFTVAESACFGCTTATEWQGYFDAVFNNPYGNVSYLRYYNLEPFLASPGAVPGLHQFIATYSNQETK